MVPVKSPSHHHRLYACLRLHYEDTGEKFSHVFHVWIPTMELPFSKPDDLHDLFFRQRLLDQSGLFSEGDSPPFHRPLLPFALPHHLHFCLSSPDDLWVLSTMGHFISSCDHSPSKHFHIWIVPFSQFHPCLL